MKTTILASSLVSASLLAPAALAAPVDQRIDKLEQEIAALKQQQSKASSGNTNITMGGYIKLDAIVSDYSDGSQASISAGEDFYIPSTIPTGGEGGDIHTHLHAKESRLWLKSETQTDSGVIKTHLEMDFILSTAHGDERISNSYSPRLRHAYFSWNNWLLGQTWSTFFNVGALPELLDFVGPAATIFIRQAQVRYTNGPLQIAVENPSTTLYGGAENPYDDNQIPDLIGRYNFDVGSAKLSVAGMIRELAYYDNANSNESKMGYAVSLSGKIPFGNGDDLRFMVNAGDALGRYMGLNSFRSGVIDANGDIELIDQVGFFAAYRHLWNSQWRSNFSISASEADNPTEAGTGVAESYQSVHANLIYKPTSALDFGAEILHATKELESGADGSMNRLQFSAKYVY